LRPTPVVSAGARGPAEQQRAELLRLERHPRSIPRSANHLQRFRALELVIGPGGKSLLLASLLLSPARLEFRQSGSSQGALRRGRFLARDGSGRLALGCGALPL